MANDRYQITLRNFTFDQAQALYRVLVDMEQGEPMYGDRGMWSGIIPSNTSRDNPFIRTITINPMKKD